MGIAAIAAIVGIAAIVLGILGYAQAFDLLINATTGTLFLLGALALFQGLGNSEGGDVVVGPGDDLDAGG